MLYFICLVAAPAVLIGAWIKATFLEWEVERMIKARLKHEAEATERLRIQRK